MGLRRRGGLSALSVSRAIATRQKAAYEDSPRVRARLEVGHQMARSGELSRLAATSDAWSRAETNGRRLAAAQRGRETQQRRVLAQIKSIVEVDARSPDSLTGLIEQYEAGSAVSELARELGISQRTLLELLANAGTRLRRTGQTTPEGRRSRAHAAEVHAAADLGVNDIASWLATEHARGVTLTDLGQQVGHSYHWVKWRIDRAAEDNGTATAT